MADEVRRPVVASPRPHPSTEASERTPVMLRGHRRSAEELEPIAPRGAENAALMEQFRASLGSGNEARGREVMDEVARYAQSLDPTITYSDGTRIVVHSDEDDGDANVTTKNKAPRPVRTLSSLDDFLKQEGKFEEFEAIAMKEVAAWQAARRAE